MSPDHALANQDAYDLWAESYPALPHNPLMRAEQHAMQQLWPTAAQLRGARALDLACGSGRYAQLLTQSGAAEVAALDFSSGMLGRLSGSLRVRGDMMRLPFGGEVFGVIVCGLALGHAPQLESWFSEVARVLAPGGVALYSDFHPQAVAAGMTRTFTDRDKRQHILRHQPHKLADHERAALAAGLNFGPTREVRVGLELNEGFAGAEPFYRRWHGVPVVFAARVDKRTDG